MKKYLQMLAILLLAFSYQIESAYSRVLSPSSNKTIAFLTGGRSNYCSEDKDRDGKSDHDHDQNGKGDGCDDDDHDHDNKNKKSKKNYCDDEDRDEDGKNDHDHDHDGKGDGCDDKDHKGDDPDYGQGGNCSGAQPRPVSGNQHPCPGDIAYYSIENTRGYTSFVWDVPRAQAGNPPAGWEILEGQGTNRVKVRVGEKSGTMKVKVTDPRCGNKVATLPVKPGKDFEVSITGKSQLCENDLQEYRASVKRTGNGNGNGNKKGEFVFTWTVPAGWVITEGQGTDLIKVKAGPADGDVSVSVKDNAQVSGNGNKGNGVGGYKQGYCGTASDRIRVITKDCGPVGPGCPTVVISGPEEVCVDKEQVFTANLQNADWNMRFAYTWQLPTGWTLVKGQGSHSITVIPGNTAGQVTVNVVDARCQDEDGGNDDDDDGDDDDDDGDDDSDYCDDDDDRDGKGDHDHDHDGKGDKCDDDDHNHDDKNKKSKTNYCNDDKDRDGRKDHDHDHNGKGDGCDDDDHKADKKGNSKGNNNNYKGAAAYSGKVAYTSGGGNDKDGNKKGGKSNYSKDDKDRDGKGDHDHDHDGKGDNCDDDDHDSKDKSKKGKSHYCNEDHDRDGKKDHDHDRDGKGDKCDDDDHRGDDRDNDGNCDDDDDGDRDDEDDDDKACCSASASKAVRIDQNCDMPVCPVPVVSVAGPDTVCAFQDEPVTYRANVTGTTDMTTYVWQVPTDWEIISGQGSASIQVQIGAESGQVSVTVANGCGTKASNTREVFANEECGVIAPLPVELISFEGEATKSGILLEWATATEKNNDRFEIERSQDGVGFARIAEVKGNGTTSVKRTYSLRDAKASRGTHYYRLKQVDFDGKFEYSQMIVVDNNNAAAAAGLLVAPNPATGQFSIALGHAEAAQLQILDMNGNLVHTQNVNQGARELNFNTSSLGMRSGMYLISIKSAAGSSHAKLVVR